ncbi:TonB-dependent siderophore receptor [Neisseria sp.]
MMFRFTPIALILLTISSQSQAAGNNDTDAPAEQKVDLETVQVRGRRLVMETGYKAERSDITGVNTSILDTPYSIDTVTNQQLEDKQPHMLEDALVGISGLHQGNNMAGTLDAVVKRGYGGNRDHSVMRNGVESTQSRSFTATAERVEVLKGPASVLYGVQDPGGVINIVAKKPLYKAENSINATVGNHNMRQVGLDTTGPIGNSGFAYRFIADYLGKEHWREHGSEHSKFRQNVLAPSISWQNGRTKFLAAYEYQNYSVPFDRGTYLDLSPKNKDSVSYGKPIDIPARRRLDEPFNISKGDAHNLQISGEHKLNNNWSVKGMYGYSRNLYNDWQARIMSYNAATRQVVRRVDGTRPAKHEGQNLQFSLNGLVDQNENITHKLRFAVQAQDNTLSFGDMYRSKNIPGFSIDNPQYVGDSLIASSGTKPSAKDSGQYERMKTAAILAQDNAYIGDKWILSAGLRGQYYRSISGKGYGANRFRNYSEGFRLLPQIGAVYLLRPDWSIYANYAQSLNPNAARGTDFKGKELPPETSRSYEVGTKYNGKLLSANLALFHITKRNIIGTVDDETRVTGKNRAYGAEIDVNGKITDKLGISANYTYTDTKILENASNPAVVGQAFDSVPEHEAGLTLTYDFGKALGGNWRVGAGARYIGSWGVGDTRGNWFTLPSATVYNAFATYDTKVGKLPLTVRLTGKNLGNKVHYISSTGSNSTMPFLSIGEPRTVTLGTKLSF